MQKYYDYFLSETNYNGIECYNFTVSVKDSLKNKELTPLENIENIKQFNNFIFKPI